MKGAEAQKAAEGFNVHFITAWMQLRNKERLLLRESRELLRAGG
jgi:hypothetical protein